LKYLLSVVYLCCVGTLPTKLVPPIVTSVGETHVELSYGRSSRLNRSRGLDLYVPSSDVSYVIRYRERMRCSEEKWIEVAETTCDSHTFTNLIPGTPYEFLVAMKIEGELREIECGRIKVQTAAAVVGE